MLVPSSRRLPKSFTVFFMSEASVGIGPDLAGPFYPQVETYVTQGMGGRGATQPELRYIPIDTPGELIEGREETLSIKPIVHIQPEPLFDHRGNPIFETGHNLRLATPIGQISGFET